MSEDGRMTHCEAFVMVVVGLAFLFAVTLGGAAVVGFAIKVLF